jgi:chromosome segregation ATPase
VVEDLHERITRVETIVERHEKKIDAQEDKNDLLTRLTIVAEQQSVFNTEFKQELKEFRITIDKVNTNLDQLNASHKQMKQDMSQIGERVSSIETKQEGSKIDVPNLMTKIVIGVFMAIPTIITAWLLIQLNLK